MEWTKEWPSEPGMYLMSCWPKFYDNDNRYNVVQVTVEHAPGKTVVLVHGLDPYRVHDASYHLLFLGPLPWCPEP